MIISVVAAKYGISKNVRFLLAHPVQLLYLLLSYALALLVFNAESHCVFSQLNGQILNNFAGK